MKKTFTLIELLIAILISSILASTFFIEDKNLKNKQDAMIILNEYETFLNTFLATFKYSKNFELRFELNSNNGNNRRYENNQELKFTTQIPSTLTTTFGSYKIYCYTLKNYSYECEKVTTSEKSNSTSNNILVSTNLHNIGLKKFENKYKDLKISYSFQNLEDIVSVVNIEHISSSDLTNYTNDQDFLLCNSTEVLENRHCDTNFKTGNLKGFKIIFHTNEELYFILEVQPNLFLQKYSFNNNQWNKID